ncbi:hypothetical protein COLO4_22356 [Corchorus olitorius]|uniref:PB1-like domain-containing protein n=1 Tax=Corchorus olitorius TaxID=93759 RepID=A0A1R3IMM4_9ROSI|nr:hypothetical protein COLO4_22356 [Corchorus olitorius]
MDPKLSARYTEEDDGSSFYIVVYGLGKLVRDPKLRYEGGQRIRGAENPDTINLSELKKLVKEHFGVNKVHKLYYFDPVEAPESQDEDAEHVDPLEEILRGRATEDAANSDGEVDEDEKGYQSLVYLSDDHHSLVGSDEDPEHDDAQWRKSSRETYARAYQYSLNPINGPNGWKKTGREELLPPLQPKAKRGRPKKNRRKAPDELTSKNGKMSKTGLPQKCGTCREEGHNKSTCPNKDRVPAVQATVPKKRGRPPKDKDKTNNDNGEAAVPKRRGRPPKDKGIFGNQVRIE